MLEHPHIVPLIDFWRDPSGAYLVMRLLGGTLADKLQRVGKPWTVEETRELLRQIGSALIFAHSKQVIQGDIKPANILLDDIDNAYLTDFGLSTVLKDPLKTKG